MATTTTKTAKPAEAKPTATKATKAKKVKVIGTQSYVNANTGEIVDMAVVSVEERDFNFTKIWMRDFIQTLDIIGNRKTTVAFWIIDHIDKDNALKCSIREISRTLGVSAETVRTTLNLLKSANFLQLKDKQSGTYMVNPDIIFKGRHTARAALVNIYSDPEKTCHEPIEDQLANITKTINMLKARADHLKGILDQKAQPKPKRIQKGA